MRTIIFLHMYLGIAAPLPESYNGLERRDDQTTSTSLATSAALSYNSLLANAGLVNPYLTTAIRANAALLDSVEVGESSLDKRATANDLGEASNSLASFEAAKANGGQGSTELRRLVDIDIAGDGGCEENPTPELVEACLNAAGLIDDYGLDFDVDVEI